MHPAHHEILERVYRDHHQKTARILGNVFHRHPHDPAIQDAIATAIDRLARLLERGRQIDRDTESGWLTVVARREYLRPYGHPESRLTRPIDQVIENTLAIREATPEQTVIRRATETGIQRALDQALGRLSKLQREVLCAQASGLSYAEIRERTGLSATAVNKAIQRGRQKLRTDGQLAREINAWRD